jgi:transcriptional regulator GlxA family with amidase domain
LDLAGPADVFSAANLFLPDAAGDGYLVEVASLSGEAVTAYGGIAVSTQKALRHIKGPIHTLLVVGGLPAADHANDRGPGRPGSPPGGQG